jgi:hypothetical protein
VSDPAAFQEIDDAVRQDELKAWWKRWGTWVVAGAVVVVVAVAGMVGWRQYDASRRAEAGSAYSATLAQIGKDDAAARAALEKQAQDAPEPYRFLAALAVAQMQATPAEQVAALQAVTAKLPPELADLAVVVAGLRGLDAGKTDEVASQLAALSGPDRPFHLSAREVQALAAAKKGDVKRARELWEELVKDREAPNGVHQRAQIMLAYYGPAEGK